MVEQFGLAMMRSVASNTSPLTSGTTSFLPASIRHALELSITVMPASANFGAHSSDVDPPAENNANRGCSFIASVILTIATSCPFQGMVLPTDFSDATGINYVTGKFRSLNTASIFVPTRPVAPTTATFMGI